MTQARGVLPRYQPVVRSGQASPIGRMDAAVPEET